MKPGGLRPRREPPEGYSPPGTHPGEVQTVPPALERPQRGSGAPTSPSKAPTQATGLGATNPPGRGRRNFSGAGLRPGTSCRRTPVPGHGPAPNPSGPSGGAGRRQEPVPDEMSLAPAGKGGGWRGGGGSGLLQAALSDSWPRREDWQGRDFIVDGKGGGGRGSGGRRGKVAGLRQQLQ